MINLTINGRIKLLRKGNGWNQTHLASLLGVTQSGISYIERDGSSVSEQTIKSLCLAIPGLNEEWLRYGTDPMYLVKSTPTSTFSLEKFIEERHGTKLELEILKAYFSLSVEIRQAMLNSLKSVFLGAERPTSAPPLDPEQTIEQLEEEYKKMLSGLAPSKASSASNITDENSSAMTSEG